MALRQQVWVDRSVQGVLVGRVILYWICGVLYVGLGSACFQYNQNPDWTLAKHGQVLFGQIWPWLPTAIFLLPLAIYDVVRMSNLFAGPIYRLRKHFAALREDIAAAPLNFREDDYWRDIAAPINDMQAEILRLRTAVIELQKAASQTPELADETKADTPNEVVVSDVPVAAIQDQPQSSTDIPEIPAVSSEVAPSTDMATEQPVEQPAEQLAAQPVEQPATDVVVAPLSPTINSTGLETPTEVPSAAPVS